MNLTKKMIEGLIHAHWQIPEREEIIAMLIKKMNGSFRPQDIIGLIYLNPREMQKVFEPIFTMIEKKFKITRVWGHFMKKGALRESHQHDAPFAGIYYLKIPEGSSVLRLDDTDEILQPVENDFIVMPSMTPHSISRHESDEVRLAIGMDLTEQ